MVDPIRKTPSSSSAAKMAVLAECISENETADASEDETTAGDDEADAAAALEERIVGFMLGAVGV